MGTSLVVFPFAFLIQMVENHVPIVLINNTNSLGNNFPNSLWLDGDLDSQVKKLA
jgi:NAD-dependent SIR2 family protein deacetylase